MIERRRDRVPLSVFSGDIGSIEQPSQDYGVVHHTESEAASRHGDICEGLKPFDLIKIPDAPDQRSLAVEEAVRVDITRVFRWDLRLRQKRVPR